MMVRGLQDADVRALRRRRWQRDLAGYAAHEDEAAVTGGITASSSTTRTAGEAIFIGVSTGVLVWAITNFLNKVFGGGK